MATRDLDANFLDAVKHNNLTTCEYMQRHGYVVTDNISSCALMVAAKYGHLDMCKRVPKWRDQNRSEFIICDFRFTLDIAMDRAKQNGHDDIYKYLKHWRRRDYP